MSLLVEGARKIVRERELSQSTLRRAVDVAGELFRKVDESGILQSRLIEQVENQAGVSLEVAAYVVDELRASGKARRDRHSGLLFRTDI